MMTSFVFMVIALKAAFDSHDLKIDKKTGKPAPIPNMYSLHSWMGIITAILFTMQWVFGGAMFLLPNISLRLRSFYLSIHTWFGTFIFVLACATALLGVTEKLIFLIKVIGYPQKKPEGIMVNIASLLIILFGSLVVYLTTAVKYKRLPKPEEMPNKEENKPPKENLEQT